MGCSSEVSDGAYVHVVGRIEGGGEHALSIAVLAIRPLDSADQITLHLLNVLTQHSRRSLTQP